MAGGLLKQEILQKPAMNSDSLKVVNHTYMGQFGGAAPEVVERIKVHQEAINKMNVDLGGDFTRTIQDKVLNMGLYALEKIGVIKNDVGKASDVVNRDITQAHQKIDENTKFKDSMHMTLALRWVDNIDNVGDFLTAIRTEPDAARAALNDHVAKRKFKLQEETLDIARNTLKEHTLGADGVAKLESNIKTAIAMGEYLHHLDNTSEAITKQTDPIASKVVNLRQTT